MLLSENGGQHGGGGWWQSAVGGGMATVTESVNGNGGLCFCPCTLGIICTETYHIIYEIIK
jgi:hypothetical protein